MKDTFRLKGLRKKLVEEVRRKGISNEQILNAIQILPRHFFIDNAFAELAYQDKAFPIGKDQTISQPYTVAFQTQLLEVQKRDKVLEIGTGSGYQAAILGMLGARVYTIERHLELHEKATKLLKSLEVGNIRTYHRDGFLGIAEFVPFDRILVTAGAAELPETLMKQLTIGGIMVIPVGENERKMLRIQRLSEDKYDITEHGTFRFVPFLPGLQ